MHVLLVSRIFRPEPSAGSFRLDALTRELAARGHRVTVLTTRPPAGLDGPERPGVEVRRARVSRDAAGYVRGYLPYLSFDLPLLWRVWAVRKVDVVIVEPPPTTGLVMRVLCALRRWRYVFYAADVWGDAASNATGSRVVLGLVRAAERASWRGAARVLSVSPGVTERLAAAGVARTTVEIGNGLDTTLFAADGPALDLGGPTFVYAGTASEVHGAGVFVEAFARVHAAHPTARLLFLGHGAERDALERAASALPDGVVTFVPRQEPEVVAEWLRGAVAALASVRPGVGYDFAFPTKLYAAASCGTRVVYAGPGPAREFVAAGDFGEVVDHDVAAVAAAMERALERPREPAERARIAAWARENVSAEGVAARAADAVTAAAGPRRGE